MVDICAYINNQDNKHIYHSQRFYQEHIYVVNIIEQNGIDPLENTLTRS